MYYAGTRESRQCYPVRHPERLAVVQPCSRAAVQSRRSTPADRATKGLPILRLRPVSRYMAGRPASATAKRPSAGAVHFLRPWAVIGRGNSGQPGRLEPGGQATAREGRRPVGRLPFREAVRWLLQAPLVPFRGPTHSLLLLFGRLPCLSCFSPRFPNFCLFLLPRTIQANPGASLQRPKDRPEAPSPLTGSVSYLYSVIFLFL